MSQTVKKTTGKKAVASRKKLKAGSVRKARLFANARANRALEPIKRKAVKDVDQIYIIAQDLYLRDIVETNHAVNSGRQTIEDLKVKYAKFKK